MPWHRSEVCLTSSYWWLHMCLRQATGLSPASVQTAMEHCLALLGLHMFSRQVLHASFSGRQAGRCKGLPSPVAAGTQTEGHIRIDHTCSQRQTHHMEHSSGT